MRLSQLLEKQQPAQPTYDPEGLTVVIAAVGATADLSGISRHAANLVRSLLTREEIAHVHLLLAPWQCEALEALLPDTPRLKLQTVAVRRGALARNLWYYNQLPRLTTQLRADILHFAYPAPLKANAFACPTVVTLHDLYPYDIPQNFGFPKVLFNRAILMQCLRAVSSIACVSESTLRRLDMYAPGLAVSKGSVVYNCVDAGPAKSPISPIRNWRGESFLLCVAQHRRNKNIALAISTFEYLHRNGELKPGAKLVIVGIPGPETKSLLRQIYDAHLTHDVVLLSGLSDSELEWCYAHCDLVMAPSLVEGFGLPVVEAMFHHCRVVCSDIPAFREVGGGYCTYANLRHAPNDGFLEATRTALGSHGFRAGATARFASERIAAEYLRLYTRLLFRSLAPTTPHRSPATGKRPPMTPRNNRLASARTGATGPASRIRASRESATAPDHFSTPKNLRHSERSMTVSPSCAVEEPRESLSTAAAKTTSTADPAHTADILNVPIHAVNMRTALQHLAHVITHGERGYVCLAGVHGVMEAQRDRTLIRTYQNATLVAPDGMPTVWIGHAQGYKHMQQVTGPDLMLALMQSEEFKGCTHFLYGGKEGVAEELRAQLTARFPQVNIIGTYTPPFGELSLQEERKIITAINAAKPDILWVGISTPRQERFMEDYLPVLDVKLMFGVGAAFDFHTGRIADCAPWIKRCGMQWLHRLLQDPRRLWKRYFRNNPAFLCAITMQFLGLRSSSAEDELSHSSPSPKVIVCPRRNPDKPTTTL